MPRKHRNSLSKRLNRLERQSRPEVKFNQDDSYDVVTAPYGS